MSDHLSRRRRGRQSEFIVAGYLADHGFPDAEPAPPSRPGEDILGVVGVAFEVKSRRGLSLKEWTRQASRYDGLPVLVIRSTGDGPANIADWTAALPLGRLVELLKDAGYAGATEEGGKHR